MYKTCNAVMLPTTEKANIVGDGNKLTYSHECIASELEIVKLLGYHLYITSDDEIKENSLVLLPDKTIHRMTSSDMIAYLDSGSKATKRIIATTQAFMRLPQPSKEFIEAYIKAYNEGKQITNVDVKYIADYESESMNIRSSQLKVNLDNTINIKLIKDNWNRTEVVELLIKAMIYANPFHLEECYEKDVNDWINDNL